MGDIAVGNSCTVEVDISDLVAVVAVDRPTDIPSVESVEGYVECHATVGAPVAVDVLRSGDASTCRLVVSHHVADGVAGSIETAVGTETPVTLGLGHVESHAVGHKSRRPLLLEVHVEVGCERGLQSWITHRDIQRVGVVINIEQLGD